MEWYVATFVHLETATSCLYAHADLLITAGKPELEIIASTVNRLTMFIVLL